MGAAPFPSSVPDDRMDQVRTRYVQPDPNVEGFEEFYYADTGEVIPPDDAAEPCRPFSQWDEWGEHLARVAAENERLEARRIRRAAERSPFQEAEATLDAIAKAVPGNFFRAESAPKPGDPAYEAHVQGGYLFHFGECRYLERFGEDSSAEARAVAAAIRSRGGW